MSALPPKADIRERDWNVRFVPRADIGHSRPRPAHHPYGFGRGPPAEESSCDCSRCQGLLKTGGRYPVVELTTAFDHVRSSRSRTELVRPLPLGRFSFADCLFAPRSNARSVHCVKHNYPDQRDKSERHKRGQRHKLLLPVVGLWTESPSLSPPSLSHSQVLTACEPRNATATSAMSAAILSASSPDGLEQSMRGGVFRAVRAGDRFLV
jgi:hypothetical protein